MIVPTLNEARYLPTLLESVAVQTLPVHEVLVAVEIAARRFEKEGSLLMSLKWIGIEAHRLVLGEIRSDPFRYFKQEPTGPTRHGLSSPGPPPPPAR